MIGPVVRDVTLSSSAKTLYQVLAAHVDDNAECSLSRQALADEVGLKIRRVQSLLNELRVRGWISWTPEQRFDGGKAPSRYVVHWQRAAHTQVQIIAPPQVQQIAPTTGTPVHLPPATPVEPEPEPAFPDRAQQIWQAWRDAVLLDAKMKDVIKAGHQRKRMNKHVRAAIEEALREYPFEDVLAAAQGWVHDPWDERHVSFADLQYVLKATNIEKFAMWHRSPKARAKTANEKAGILDPVPRGSWKDMSGEQLTNWAR